MKVTELVEKLGLKVFTTKVSLDKAITGGYVSDMLSDVMGFAQEGHVWMTLQNHMNVVAVASLKDLACIILVKGLEPNEAMIARAANEDVVILGSKEQTFDLAGKVYELLK